MRNIAYSLRIGDFAHLDFIDWECLNQLALPSQMHQDGVLLHPEEPGLETPFALPSELSDMSQYLDEAVV